MNDEPTSNKQSNSKQDGQDGQPVAFPPPEGQQETHSQDDAGDFASDNVEAAHGEQCADDGGAEIARGQGDGADAAGEVSDATFMGVEGD